MGDYVDYQLEFADGWHYIVRQWSEATRTGPLVWIRSK